MDDDLLVIERIDDNTSLCVSSLSKRLLEESEVDNLGSHRGLFVYELQEGCQSGIQVLGKVASLEAAFRLIDLFKMLKKNGGAAA